VEAGLIPAFDVVVGLDARGFLLGPVLSIAANKPFLPARKAGKMPGECATVAYGTEYSRDTLQMQKATAVAGARALLVDDLLATGGSLKAAATLVAQLGMVPVAALVLVDVPAAGGGAALAAANIPAFTLWAA
jgi:adenine phosphoribosyltransferase